MFDQPSGRRRHATASGPRHLRPLLTAGGALLTAAALAAPAQAAFPGTNGRVVYENAPTRLDRSAAFYPYWDNVELWTADANGGDQKPLVTYEGSSRRAAHDPSVSPNGKLVAYVESSEFEERKEEIHVVGIDGTGDRVVANAGSSAGAPAWAPDNQHVVFVQQGEGVATRQPAAAEATATDTLQIVSIDGGDAKAIKVNGLGNEERTPPLANPQWSPDGKYIAFDTWGSDGRFVFVVPATGGEAMLAGDRTYPEYDCTDDAYPNWAPDGSALVLQRYASECSLQRGKRSAKTGTGDQIVEVAFENGKPGAETRLDGIAGKDSPRRPVYSADGLNVLYVRDFYDPAQPQGRTPKARHLKGVPASQEVWIAGADGSNPRPFIAGKRFRVDAPDAAPVPKPRVEQPKPPVVVVSPIGGVKGVTSHRCGSRRNFVIRLRPRSSTIVMARVIINGKRVKAKHGKRWTASVDLRGLPKKRFKVDVTVWTKDGRRIHEVRRYWTCTPAR